VKKLTVLPNAGDVSIQGRRWIPLGAKSQRKGAAAERELAAILRERGYDARRGGSLSFGEVPDLYGLDGVHIEVKRREGVNMAAALRQAAADAEKFGDGLPCVFHRSNRQSWKVTMELSNWLKLYEKSLCSCGGHCGAAETGENRATEKS